MRVLKRSCVLIFRWRAPATEISRRRRSRFLVVAHGERRHAPFPRKALLVKRAVLRQHQEPSLLECSKRFTCCRVFDVNGSASFAYTEADLPVVEAVPALRHFDVKRSL